MQKLLDVLPKIQFLQQDFFHRDKTVDVTISFFLVSLTLATLILLWSKRLNPKIRPKYYAPKHEKAYEEKWRICLDEELRNTLEQETRNVSITVLSQSHQFENFVAKHIMGENTFSSKLSANVSIIAIGIDEGSKDETLYVWLRVEWEGERNIFCIPLEEFGLALAAIMEIQLTTASFVFVCDASSGLGSEIIEAIAKESLGMRVLNQPLWLAQFARFAINSHLSEETLAKFLFGLFRLEVSHDSMRVQKIVATVGQAMVAVLAPLFQKAFPSERHVFIYDGCASSVARGVAVRNQRTSKNNIETYQELQITTPLYVDLRKSIPSLQASLENMPPDLADTLETWMTSVDTYLRLKKEESKSKYQPFACKLSLLLALGTSEERRLALQNLMQYCTGSGFQEFPQKTMKQAFQSLAKVGMRQPQLKPFDSDTYTQIGNTVFCHKGIIIGDRTLKDTVLPAEKWTLTTEQKMSMSAMRFKPHIAMNQCIVINE